MEFERIALETKKEEEEEKRKKKRKRETGALFCVSERKRLSKKTKNTYIYNLSLSFSFFSVVGT
jgi:hypothetical protein